MHDLQKLDDIGASTEVVSRMQFSGLILDLDACALARESGETIPLTRGELALLRMFVNRPGRVLSRYALLGALSDRRFEPFDRSVDVLVGRLRRKIEPNPKDPTVIVTIPGVGYKLSVAVRPAAPAAALEPTAAEVDTAGRPSEKRYLTVLDAELLPARDGCLSTDPEDLRTLVDIFRRSASKALAQYGGAIGGTRGRVIVAYFGHPVAQENDVERAVRAALALRRALSEFNVENAGKGGREVAARIGIEFWRGFGRPEWRGFLPRVLRRGEGPRGRRARFRADHRDRAAAGRRPVPRRTARRLALPGCARTDQPLSNCSRERSGPPQGSTDFHPSGRPRGGVGYRHATLGTRSLGQRSVHSDCWRSGRRQVAPD